jgi:secondary thiamine-phosphate synthase enzyme
MVDQFSFTLAPRSRGFHLITSIINDQLRQSTIHKGIAHLFIHHTSASLTINENADPTVRSDMEAFVNHLVPEKTSFFQHTYEGSDDMPAHIKSSVFGSSVSFPVSESCALLGTWQGIYLCEHRNHGGSRKVTLTVIGE